MSEFKVSRTAVPMFCKMPLSHLSYFILLLPVLCLPHLVNATNTTSPSHHRYHPATNAGLTHRSNFSPSVAAHRSRYLGSRDASAFPRSRSQQTRLETSRNLPTRSDNRHGTSSTFWSPIPTRNHPKFNSPTTSTQARHPVPVDRRLAAQRSDRGLPADPVVDDTEPFEDAVTSSPAESSKGASISKLDAMLSRLESTNDEMLEELQHERDLVEARRREHHQERINRHQNRRRRPNRRHDNEPQPRINDISTINSGTPFNLAGTSDVIPRPHNQHHHRRNNQHHSASSPDPAFQHRSHYDRGDDGITRLESPSIIPDQGVIRNHQHSRNPHHRSDNSNAQYYSPGGGRGSAVLPSDVELQDLVTPGEEEEEEEEATFMEEADYQDEQAAKGRTGAHQHHLRERDAQSLRLASENVRYVMTNARCASPVRRCIDLSVNQTVIGKKYWPRCAIVSRCGEESGCCYSPDHVCTVAESHLIDLYFFYVTFEANSRAGVDRLTFENHTKCECRPRPPPVPVTLAATLPNDQPSSYRSQQDSPSDDRPTQSLRQDEDVRGGHENTFHAEPLRMQQQEEDVLVDEDTSNAGRNARVRETPPPSVAERHYGHGRGKDKHRGDDSAVKSLHSEATTESSQELKTTRSSVSETTTAAAVIAAECTCPEVYFPSASPSVPGACECVCDTGTGNCRRLMKGKRYFKSKDEKCILSGECGVPSCKFGPFLTNYKRCPRKREAKKGRSRP